MKRYVTKTKLDVNELVLDETTEPWVVLEKDCTFKIRGDVIDKLAEYEGLEEQGRLIKLPCKVGDTLYWINGKFIINYKITGFSVDEDGVWIMHAEHCGHRGYLCEYARGYKKIYCIRCGGLNLRSWKN